MPKKGYKPTEEHKRKLSESHKGKKPSEVSKQKMSESRKGKKHSEETKRKICKNHVGMLDKNHSEETRQKISLARKGKKWTEEIRKKISESHKGKRHTEESKRKQRLSAIKYIKKVRGKVSPNIGRNEKVILDSIENQLGYKILRQHPIRGYFLDGYIFPLNLVIEIDERSKNTQRDINREQEIKKYLNCEVLRIEDY